jgi:hypothetical protein
MNVSEYRKDWVAVIASELREAAEGDVTAVATIQYAAEHMPMTSAPPRMTHHGGMLLPRYHAAREALKPDLIGRALDSFDRATRLAAFRGGF